MDPEGRDGPARHTERRSDSDRVVAWAPGFDDPETAGESGEAEPATADPQPSRPPDTLGDLDLTVTPVSVTPPRTWRRAAWFSVCASCVVLTVLVFAAARLAERPYGRIDAFPGLPTGGLLTAQPVGPPGPAAPTATTGAGPDGGTAIAGSSSGPSPGPAAASGAPGGDPDVAEPPGPEAAPPTGEIFVESAPVPTVTVRPTSDRSPVVSADDLVDATKQFYDLLPHEVESAWAMVGPKVKGRGYESFRRQWGDLAAVHLQQVVVDTDSSTVLATVQTVAADGTTQVELYQLTYQKGNSLIIDEIAPTGEGGRKPVR